MQVKQLLKATVLPMIALTMMGNQSCEQPQAETRELKRRVQISYLEAPEMTLPDGGRFDFAYVARQQLANILSKTKTFTTARVDPNKIYDTAGLTPAEDAQFYQCIDDADTVGNGLSAKSTLSQTAACMIEMPHGLVSGSIYDFSLISKTGGTLGLSAISFLTLANASFTYEKSELSVQMRAVHPLMLGGITGETADKNGRMIIATTDQKAYAKNWGGSLNIGFSIAQIGGSAYFKSNLSNVVEDGVSQALGDMKKSWDSHEPWYAMVLRSCDKFIYINAGSSSDMGLKVGDIVKIQNVTYEWEGRACGSRLLSTIDSGIAGGAQPVGYARVTTVGVNIAAAEILDKDPNYPHSAQTIKPGARVYMEKMVVPAPVQAKK